MKQKTILAVSICAYVCTLGLGAQDPKISGIEAITRQAVQAQLEFLASDWTEGRATGERGAYLAADYIASMFKLYGLQPGGDRERIYPTRTERWQGKRPEEYRSYFQNFNLIEYAPGKHQELSLLKSSSGNPRYIHFTYRTDFSLTLTEVGMEAEAAVVFVGYGYEHVERGYDDYQGVDAKGKIVIRLRGYPGHNDPLSEAYQEFSDAGTLGYWRINRAKNEKALKEGAIAVIEIDLEDDAMDNWTDNLPFRYDSRMYEGETRRASYYDTRMKLPGDTLSDDLTLIHASKRVLHAITGDAGINIRKYTDQVKKRVKPASMEIPGVKIRLKTRVDSRVITARNVIGVLPGKDTGNSIVVGAHYDHLGMHDGYIWNGADDNASGTVGVMSIARACMATGVKPEKTIIFAAWSGEEKGLLGSRYFADNPYREEEKVNLYLNYDMISRDDQDDTLGNQCRMVYTEAYPVLETLSEKHNEEFGLGLDITYRPYARPRGGSDHSSFSRLDIPVFYFMAGFPMEYHQPDDHVNLVNWNKMTRIIQLGFLDIWEFANDTALIPEQADQGAGKGPKRSR